MSNIVPFDFNGKQVRVFEDENGEPWFVAKDVCSLLGLSNVSQAIKSLEKEDIGGVYSNDAISRRRHLVTVSEPGLYDLVFQSRKPEARKFQRWVTKEVLPQIRKTGIYAPDSHQKLLERYVLVQPDEWVKRFPDLFYQYLRELTVQSVPEVPERGRPPLWGQLTKRWVYDRLPHEIGEALKAARDSDDTSRYLHLHLSSDGIELFKDHMGLLVTYMDAASSWQDVDRMLANVDSKTKQMELKLRH